MPSSKALHDAITILNQGTDQSETTMNRAMAAKNAIATAAELLTGDLPMGGSDWDHTMRDLGDVQHHLEDLRDHFDFLVEQQPNSQELKDILTGIEDALSRVGARRHYLDSFSGSHSLSQTKVAEAKLGWVEAASRAIDAEIAKLPGNENGDFHNPKTMDLENLKIQLLNEAITNAKEADPEITVADGGNLKTAHSDLAGRIAAGMKELGIPCDKKALAKAIYEQHIDVLNDRDWDPIHGEIQFVHDGVPHTFSSDITPAAHLETTKASYGGKGICCQSRSEANHMVNMAQTTLKDSAGNELFSGIRHGIVSAFGLKNRTDRQAANNRRAEELLLGVIAGKPGLLQAAMNQQDGDAPLEVDLTSINLLTPDPIRFYLSGRSGGATDRAITRDQLNTLQGIDGQELTLRFTDSTGTDRTVRVKPSIAAFSFGVNEGATRDSLGGAAMYYGGGKASFEHVRADNALAMNKLIGDPTTADIGPDSKIGKFLADPNRSEMDKKVVRELREQIRDMWNNDNYMAHGGDPHKMVSRIAVLTHLLGETPCFNCKSGKDRTGTLDVEAKFLATRIDFAKKKAAAEGLDPDTVQLVPTPGPLSKEDQAIFRQFAIRSGNLEVQEYNTGIGGYKTAAQKALQRRLGTEEAISRFKGGSAHVKA